MARRQCIQRKHVLTLNLEHLIAGFYVNLTPEKKMSLALLFRRPPTGRWHSSTAAIPKAFALSKRNGPHYIASSTANIFNHSNIAIAA